MVSKLPMLTAMTMVIILLSSSLITVNALPPLERVDNRQPILLDENLDPMKKVFMSGNLYEINNHERVIIQSMLTNLQDKAQPFVYLVQIKDTDSITVSLSWITGRLDNKQRTNVTQSWVPDRAGSYTIETFVWESIEKPIALSSVPIVDVVVVPQSEDNVKGSKLVVHSYPHLTIFDFGHLVIKGTLVGDDLRPLKHQQVTIAIDSFVLNGRSIPVNDPVGNTYTDADGCFYFNGFANYTDQLLHEMLRQRLGVITHTQIIFKISYYGNANYSPASTTTSINYYPFAVPLPPPQATATFFNGSQQTSNITIKQGESTTLVALIEGLRTDLGSSMLDVKNLPCGADASLVPNEVEIMKGSSVNSSLKISVGTDTKPGNYTLYITAKIAKSGELMSLGTITLQVIEK